MGAIGGFSGGSLGMPGAGGLGQLPGAGQGALGQMPDQGGDEAGGSFADTLRSIVVDNPTATQNKADALATEFAAGGNIDPHQLAIATAKAGVEVQMATRTISQAVSAVRTLFQMQI
jgi:flagellar hook-basal body complex protein FliE